MIEIVKGKPGPRLHYYRTTYSDASREPRFYTYICVQIKESKNPVYTILSNENPFPLTYVNLEAHYGFLWRQLSQIQYRL